MTAKLIPVTFAAGTSVSNAALPGDQVVCGFIVPVGWTAAALSYLVSDDSGVTFNALFDDGGNELNIASAVMVGAAARNPGRISTDPSAFASVVRLQLRSGLSTAAVNQVSAVTVYIVTRKFYAMS
jgi:hypothetical protein